MSLPHISLFENPALHDHVASMSTSRLYKRVGNASFLGTINQVPAFLKIANDIEGVSISLDHANKHREKWHLSNMRKAVEGVRVSRS